MGYLTPALRADQDDGQEGRQPPGPPRQRGAGFALLDEAPEVPERPDARPLARAAGAVEFRDVSFAYEPDRPVLEDVSFAVEPGTRVGIAGRHRRGQDDADEPARRASTTRRRARSCSTASTSATTRLADLRNQFGIVLQEPVLFSTSIAENIAYARPDATQDEIEAAAAAANAHDFIVALPDGYETQVGERGMRLSGGERQRISLARAFLKDAPILILDEPTSSVDVKTEAVIMEAMERLMAGPHELHDRPPPQHARRLRSAARDRRRPRSSRARARAAARARATARRGASRPEHPAVARMAVAGRREAAAGDGPEGEQAVPQARRLPARGSRPGRVARDRKDLQAEDRGGREHRLRGAASAPARCRACATTERSGTRTGSTAGSSWRTPATSATRPRTRSTGAWPRGGSRPSSSMRRSSCRPRTCRTGDRGTTWSTS